MQAACGVDQHDGSGLLTRPGQRTLRDVDGFIPRWLGVDGDIKLFAQLLQLRHGGGALHVACDHYWFLVLFAQRQGQLGNSCRLTRALQTDQHDHRRWRAGKVDFGFARIGPAQHLDQFIVDQRDHLLGRI